MGNFVCIDKEFVDEEERFDGKGLGKGQRLVLWYENGQGCWNGFNRRIDVYFGCVEIDEVWCMVEVEKCVYRMEVGFLVVCEDVQEFGVLIKDELQRDMMGEGVVRCVYSEIVFIWVYYVQ